MQKNKNIELRVISEPFNMDNDTTFLGGYASVFNVGSIIYDPVADKKFIETIKPGAFTKTIAERDILFLVNHNNMDIPLGRTKSGTLQLMEDNVGLNYRLNLPQSRKDIKESVQRKDMSGMSFAFWVTKDKWYTNEGMLHRDVLEAACDEISLCSDPAYTETTCSIVRSAEKSPELRALIEGTSDKEAEVKEVEVTPAVTEELPLVEGEYLPRVKIITPAVMKEEQHETNSFALATEL